MVCCEQIASPAKHARARPGGLALREEHGSLFWSGGTAGGPVRPRWAAASCWRHPEAHRRLFAGTRLGVGVPSLAAVSPEPGRSPRVRAKRETASRRRTGLEPRSSPHQAGPVIARSLSRRVPTAPPRAAVRTHPAQGRPDPVAQRAASQLASQPRANRASRRRASPQLVRPAGRRGGPPSRRSQARPAPSRALAQPEEQRAPAEAPSLTGGKARSPRPPPPPQEARCGLDNSQSAPCLHSVMDSPLAGCQPITATPRKGGGAGKEAGGRPASELRFNSLASAPERETGETRRSLRCAVWHLLKCHHHPLHPAPTRTRKRGAGIMYSSPPRHHLSFLRINNIWIGNQILTEIFARRMAYFFFSPPKRFGTDYDKGNCLEAVFHCSASLVNVCKDEKQTLSTVFTP
ncbi:translation initiation factor IF-2-like [Mesocricetus auratus]|uniref:Translation initiation factor IF-2-like n=1 Tax=Mesocricetus auratus TaxID=10036 RepID=A0ABM2XSG3_MESAU|nr:translation initiation factor IF-2-like [Mesocricetus auratus]